MGNSESRPVAALPRSATTDQIIMTRKRGKGSDSRTEAKMYSIKSEYLGSIVEKWQHSKRYSLLNDVTFIPNGSDSQRLIASPVDGTGVYRVNWSPAVNLGYVHAGPRRGNRAEQCNQKKIWVRQMLPYYLHHKYRIRRGDDELGLLEIHARGGLYRDVVPGLERMDKSEQRAIKAALTVGKYALNSAVPLLGTAVSAGTQVFMHKLVSMRRNKIDDLQIKFTPSAMKLGAGLVPIDFKVSFEVKDLTERPKEEEQDGEEKQQEEGEKIAEGPKVQQATTKDDGRAETPPPPPIDVPSSPTSFSSNLDSVRSTNQPFNGGRLSSGSTPLSPTTPSSCGKRSANKSPTSSAPASARASATPARDNDEKNRNLVRVTHWSSDLFEAYSQPVYCDRIKRNAELRRGLPEKRIVSLRALTGSDAQLSALIAYLVTLVSGDPAAIKEMSDPHYPRSSSAVDPHANRWPTVAWPPPEEYPEGVRLTIERTTKGKGGKRLFLGGAGPSVTKSGAFLEVMVEGKEEEEEEADVGSHAEGLQVEMKRLEKLGLVNEEGKATVLTPTLASKGVDPQRIASANWKKGAQTAFFDHHGAPIDDVKAVLNRNDSLLQRTTSINSPQQRYPLISAKSMQKRPYQPLPPPPPPNFDAPPVDVNVEENASASAAAEPPSSPIIKSATSSTVAPSLDQTKSDLDLLPLRSQDDDEDGAEQATSPKKDNEHDGKKKQPFLKRFGKAKAAMTAALALGAAGGTGAAVATTRNAGEMESMQQELESLQETLQVMKDEMGDEAKSLAEEVAMTHYDAPTSAVIFAFRDTIVQQVVTTSAAVSTAASSAVASMSLTADPNVAQIGTGDVLVNVTTTTSQDGGGIMAATSSLGPDDVDLAALGDVPADVLEVDPDLPEAAIAAPQGISDALDIDMSQAIEELYDLDLLDAGELFVGELLGGWDRLIDLLL